MLPRLHLDPGNKTRTSSWSPLLAFEAEAFSRKDRVNLNIKPVKQSNPALICIRGGWARAWVYVRRVMCNEEKNTLSNKHDWDSLAGQSKICACMSPNPRGQKCCRRIRQISPFRQLCPLTCTDSGCRWWCWGCAGLHPFLFGKNKPRIWANVKWFFSMKT